MTIGDILVNTNRANLNNLLPLSEVKTKKGFRQIQEEGLYRRHDCWGISGEIPASSH